MNILDELTDGYFTKKIKNQNRPSTAYNIYVKFDNDTPLILFKDVDENQITTFTFDNKKNKFFEVACPYTGKKLKFYVKGSNESPQFNQKDYDNLNNINEDEDEDEHDENDDI